ncbi:hypothetical protein RRG08_014316 [Elysia crispata]|uniref:Uncharacterized protein n=1 Tax=Elysia crispata TaxID=231223 RepID=A0AAE0Z2A7_9GAST|nr:hypothetical protein RRG08_014316 [Elysia crispata]
MPYGCFIRVPHRLLDKAAHQRGTPVPASWSPSRTPPVTPVSSDPDSSRRLLIPGDLGLSALTPQSPGATSTIPPAAGATLETNSSNTVLALVL